VKIFFIAVVFVCWYKVTPLLKAQQVAMDVNVTKSNILKNLSERVNNKKAFVV
jgi:hypothetical protein